MVQIDTVKTELARLADVVAEYDYRARRADLKQVMHQALNQPTAGSSLSSRIPFTIPLGSPCHAAVLGN